MNRIKEIEARLAAIAAEIEKRGDEITVDEIKTLEAEVRELKEERATLTAANETRAAILADIAEGRSGQVVRAMPTPAVTAESRDTAPAAEADPADTPEYRKAFMEFVCRGTPIPAELRANQKTTVSDVTAQVPTTLLNELITKLDSYGGIYQKVRKLNIQGGVEIPILSVKPTATWVGEGKSDSQKLESKTKVTFNYYGLECKLAQSLLASVVTLASFQTQFVQLATEAIVKALEKGIFNGSGSGQMLGILNDTRIPSGNSITLLPADITKWDAWKKKVFAKMAKAYRNGIFVMAQGTFDGYIDGMVDSNGQPIGRINYGITDGEQYRFGGKTVETVEDDVIASYDDASTGDVIGVFFNPTDYAINSNMNMTVVKWTDHDNNEEKNKATVIVDGKLIDPNGVLLIKKGGAAGGGSGSGGG